MFDPSRFALSLKPPYYVVVFTSQRTHGDHGYGAMAEKMGKLAALQPGYLGFEAVRHPDGMGVTLSYWETPEAIRNWKDQSEHLMAQDHGIQNWYEHYEVRVARVERAYSGPTGVRHATAWDATA